MPHTAPQATLKTPYTQSSHNSQNNQKPQEGNGVLLRILRILRLVLRSCFQVVAIQTALYALHMGLRLVASHVLVGRERLLCEAARHFTLPAVA